MIVDTVLLGALAKPFPMNHICNKRVTQYDVNRGPDRHCRIGTDGLGLSGLLIAVVCRRIERGSNAYATGFCSDSGWLLSMDAPNPEEDRRYIL